jgi:3-hydroxybutyryl-CoA dehydratase
MAMLKPQAASDLEREIDLGAWEVTEDSVREYTRAVGDSLPLYFDCKMAPPLAISAWALGRLLSHLDLPPGAIHSLQEMKTLRAVRFGEQVGARVRIGKPRRRGGMEFITAEFSIGPDSQEVGGSGPPAPAITGKTTVLVTNAHVAAPDEGSATPEVRQQPPDMVEPGGLTHLERTITQSQLDAYAKASGDFNPLHLDQEFAATTGFGGIIAHGMLTLALISENMAGEFGIDWLTTGGLRVRFKGAAYLGDRIATRRQIIEKVPQEGGHGVKCSVQVFDQGDGRELISGDASVFVKSQNLEIAD